MANLDAPNGAKPVRHLTGGVIRAREWKIASGSSTAIFTGDFVKLLSTGYIDDIVFAIQGDGTDAFTQVGNLANIVATAGSTTTGQSKMELDTDNIGTGTANLRILGITDDPKNSWGANTEQEVLIHEHELNQHIDADGTVGV